MMPNSLLIFSFSLVFAVYRHCHLVPGGPPMNFMSLGGVRILLLTAWLQQRIG